MILPLVVSSSNPADEAPTRQKSAFQYNSIAASSELNESYSPLITYGLVRRTQPTTQTNDRILDSLPNDIRAAIMTYARESVLSANAVIEGALKRFLELDTSLSRESDCTAEDISLVAALPPVLQSQAIQYAEQTEIPSELVIELAIAHFLDPDSVTFDDCQVKVEKTLIAWLKQYAGSEAATAA